MAGSQMDARRDNSRMRSGGEGVVLLQRGNREGQVREYDTARDAGRSSSALSGRSECREVDSVASLNIQGLTDGERLLIARRRSGESQETIARRHGITRNVYGRIERDDEEFRAGIALPELGELTDDEKCLLLRRRSGLTQEECAEYLGVTRFWFNQMETGKVPCSDLVKFWESRA